MAKVSCTLCSQRCDKEAYTNNGSLRKSRSLLKNKRMYSCCKDTDIFCIFAQSYLTKRKTTHITEFATVGKSLHII